MIMNTKFRTVIASKGREKDEDRESNISRFQGYLKYSIFKNRPVGTPVISYIVILFILLIFISGLLAFTQYLISYIKKVSLHI